MASPKRSKQGWSPHSAALHRRRKGSTIDRSAILGSLSDLGDDLPLPGAGKGKKGQSAEDLPKFNKRDKTRTSQEHIPMDIQRKLAVFTDPATPMKQRVELEVEMRNNEKEYAFLTEFRHTFDRKQFLEAKKETDQEEQARLDKFQREEAVRVAKEQEDLNKARLAEIEAEIAMQEKEIQLKKKVTLHQKKVLAGDAATLRKNAESAVAGVAERQAKERLEEQEREARKQKMRRKEGKNLTDVEIVLKEAIIDQVETKSADRL